MAYYIDYIKNLYFESQYPFEHHTRLRDMHFNNIKTWLAEGVGKSPLNDFYMHYTAVLLSFMDRNYFALKDLDIKRHPEICVRYNSLTLAHYNIDLTKEELEETYARYNSLKQTDEVPLCFLPCYFAILVMGFFKDAEAVYTEKNEKIDYEAVENAVGAYYNVLMVCTRRFLITYATTYNVPYDKLYDGFKGKIGKYFNFIKNPHIEAEKVYAKMQEALLDDLDDKFLASLDFDTDILIIALLSANMKAYFESMIVKMVEEDTKIFYLKLREMLDETMP